MWPLLAAMTLAVAVQPPPHSSSAATPPQQGKKTMTRKDDSKRLPDMELIGYLGDYGDAADGLDPLGLAENAAALKASKTPPKPARDAHP